MVGGKRGLFKSDFISKRAIIKHLMRGEGGQKRAKIICRRMWKTPNEYFSGVVEKRGSEN